MCFINSDKSSLSVLTPLCVAHTQNPTRLLTDLNLFPVKSIDWSGFWLCAWYLLLEYRFTREKLSWTLSNGLMKKNPDQSRPYFRLRFHCASKRGCLYCALVPSFPNQYVSPSYRKISSWPEFLTKRTKTKRAYSLRMRQRKQLRMPTHTHVCNFLCHILPRILSLSFSISLYSLLYTDSRVR